MVLTEMTVAVTRARMRRAEAGGYEGSVRLRLRYRQGLGCGRAEALAAQSCRSQLRQWQ